MALLSRHSQVKSRITSYNVCYTKLLRWQYLEVSVNSPAGVPVFGFKTVIGAAGLLLFLQGIAQVFRCILCIREGYWRRAEEDVRETEDILIEQAGNIV